MSDEKLDLQAELEWLYAMVKKAPSCASVSIDDIEKNILYIEDQLNITRAIPENCLTGLAHIPIESNCSKQFHKVRIFNFTRASYISLSDIFNIIMMNSKVKVKIDSYITNNPIHKHDVFKLSKIVGHKLKNDHFVIYFKDLPVWINYLDRMFSSPHDTDIWLLLMQVKMHLINCGGALNWRMVESEV